MYTHHSVKTSFRVRMSIFKVTSHFWMIILVRISTSIQSLPNYYPSLKKDPIDFGFKAEGHSSGLFTVLFLNQSTVFKLIGCSDLTHMNLEVEMSIAKVIVQVCF